MGSRKDPTPPRHCFVPQFPLTSDAHLSGPRQERAAGQPGVIQCRERRVDLLLQSLIGSCGRVGQLTRAGASYFFMGSVGGVCTCFMAAVAKRRAQAWEFLFIRAPLPAGSPEHPTTAAGCEGEGFQGATPRQSSAPSGRGCLPWAERVPLTAEGEKMEPRCLCPSCPSLRARLQQDRAQRAVGVK